MGFQTALSGLSGAQSELNVIGNNIANSATTGFKQARAEFVDVYPVGTTGTASLQIGGGVRLAAVKQSFTQGNVSFTDRDLDLAISGNGFFALDDNGQTVYSRAGSFHANKDGYVVNSQAQRLQIFQADANGNITGATGDFYIDRSNIAPRASDDPLAGPLAIGVNLDAQDSVPGSPGVSVGFTAGDGLPPGSSTAIAINMDDLASPTPNTVASTINMTWNGAGWDVTMAAGGTIIPASVPMSASDTTLSFTWVPPAANNSPNVPITLSLGNLDRTGVAPLAVNATSATAPRASFDPLDPTTYNNSTSLTVYDSLGGSHLMQYYFIKSTTPNEWEMFTLVDGVNYSSGTTSGQLATVGTMPDGAPGTGQAYTVTFDSAGNLSTIDGAVTSQVTMQTIPFSAAGLLSAPADLTLTLDMQDSTQFGANFAVNNLRQGGFTTGSLVTVDVDQEGIVFARFSNGQARVLGQVALTSFPNANGLRNIGDTAWVETFESGAALQGAPGTSTLGLIQSGALEDSNVDITEQLVKLITAQRNFQANAQVVSTEDTITQTIVNLR